MADNRANIRITFSAYGQTRKVEMSINYVADGDDGIDERVSQWFREAFTDCRAVGTRVKPSQTVEEK